MFIFGGNSIDSAKLCRVALLSAALVWPSSPAAASAILETGGAVAALVGAASGMVIPAIQAGASVKQTAITVAAQERMFERNIEANEQNAERNTLLAYLQTAATERINAFNGFQDTLRKKLVSDERLAIVREQVAQQDRESHRDFVREMRLIDVQEKYAGMSRKIQEMQTQVAAAIAGIGKAATRTVDSYALATTAESPLSVRALESSTVAYRGIARSRAGSVGEVLEANPLIAGSTPLTLARGGERRSALRSFQSQVSTGFSSPEASRPSARAFAGAYARETGLSHRNLASDSEGDEPAIRRLR